MKNKILIYISSILSGFIIMSLEMTVSRSLSPYFGTSSFIWALIISVTMSLIFIGNLIGGRIADKFKSMSTLFITILFASFLINSFTRLTSFGLFYVFNYLRLNGFYFILIMIGSTFLLSSPIVLLSFISPINIKLLSENTNSVGKISGLIYALSTIGGLFGTLVPILFLIPLIGIDNTLMGLSLLLFAFGALGNTICSSFKKCLVLILLVLLSFATYLLKEKLSETIVFNDNSPDNIIWVSDEGNRKCLKVNDRRAIQSLLYKDEDLLPYDVWSLYLTAPMFVSKTDELKVLFLGLGAGTASYYYNKYFPKCKMTGVEIDEKIIEVGKKFFKLASYPIRIVNSDCRNFINQDEDTYDIIILDTFKFPYIPDHLTTYEFFIKLKSRLSKEGVLLINVGRHKEYDDVVKNISQTNLRIFNYVYKYKVENISNTFLFVKNENYIKKNADELIDFFPQKIISLCDSVNNNLTLEKIIEGYNYSTDDTPKTEYLTNIVIWKSLNLF